MTFGLHGHNYFSHAACAPLVDGKARPPTGKFHWYSSAHLSLSLTPDSCMQRNGIPLVYERAASQLPTLRTLYVCPVENVWSRVPLLPCYLKGNLHNTILDSLRHHVPAGAAADSRQDSGTGSRLFEVNIWMWCYWRAFPLIFQERFRSRMQRRCAGSAFENQGLEELKL
jgi:hypothetical protein